MKRKISFRGDTYDIPGEDREFVTVGGGPYSVEWKELGITDDYGMEYSIEHTKSGFYLGARVTYDREEVEPAVEDWEIESNDDSFEEIDLDTFKQIWNDVRDGQIIR